MNNSSAPIYSLFDANNNNNNNGFISIYVMLAIQVLMGVQKILSMYKKSKCKIGNSEMELNQSSGHDIKKNDNSA